MTQKEFYSFDEVKERFLGLKGTSVRNIYEQEVSVALQAYKNGVIKTR